MKIFFFLLLGFCQLSFAGQIHEVDVAECKQRNLWTYQGDTVRFINSSEVPHSVSSSVFNYQNISPNEYFDYTFTTSETVSYLFPFLRIRYDCGVIDNLPSLVVRHAPIAIYPKKYLLSTKEAFNISIYVLSDGDGEYDRDITQLSITVDGIMIFQGSRLDYKNFIAKQTNNTMSYAFNQRNCPIVLNFDPWCNGVKGYSVTSFHIVADTFRVGTHIIRVKLKLNTPNGEVEYEDKAEYLMIEPAYK